MIEFIKNYHNPHSLYINEDNKWLWLRIHKNAGTSMFDFLKDHCINDPKLKGIYAKRWLQNITEKEIEKYFIWTCVRNPYDRFMSIAAMFSSNPNKFAENFYLYRNKSIIKRHSEPQHKFTHDKGVQVPTMILRFETVTEDFKKLCSWLDLPEHELTKMNTTKHGHYEDELNEDTIKLINDFYHLDFEYFNYKKL